LLVQEGVQEEFSKRMVAEVEALKFGIERDGSKYGMDDCVAIQYICLTGTES
jgi:acyl-CoA reductase-like NAD-dependent aldehyde dehydrogenase